MNLYFGTFNRHKPMMALLASIIAAMFLGIANYPTVRSQDIERFAGVIADERAVPIHAVEDKVGMQIEILSAACVAPPADMVAWWPLDEVTGSTAFDLAGQSHHAQHREGPTPAAGIVDGALSFNSSAQLLEVADHPDFNFGTDDFTFAAWIKPGTDNFATLAEKWDTDTETGYSIYISPTPDGNRLNIVLGGAGGSNNFPSTDPNFTMAYDQWHYVAVVVARNTENRIRFYIDGATTDVFNTSHDGNLDNSGNLYMAAASNSLFDEIMVFNRALTEGELDVIFEAGSAGQCKQIGEIKGNVWDDTNANGLRDAGEPALAGIPVRLQSDINCTLSITTTTNTDGEYTFSGLDPSQNYYVTFEAPDGTIFSPQDVGGDDSVDSDIHPNTGQSGLVDVNSNIDVGLSEQVDSNTSSISGEVLRLVDDTREGVCGVSVNLQDAAGDILTTMVTNADGDYRFIDLEAGDYFVEIVEPDGATIDSGLMNVPYFVSLQADVDAELPSTILIVSEINGDTLDCDGTRRTGEFGVYGRTLWDGNEIASPSSVAQTYTIEGYAWNDLNGNGSNDDNSYAKGVEISCNCSTNPREENKLQITTDENGYYRFHSLRFPKAYTVKVNPSTGRKLNRSSNSLIDPDTASREDIIIESSVARIDVGLTIAQGNVNCDESINAADGLFILQSIIFRGIGTTCPQPGSFDETTPMYGDVCDVTGDNICDASDTVRILRCAIGIEEAPCPPDLVSASMNRRGSRISPVDKTQDMSNTIAIPSQQINSSDTFTVPIIAKVDQVLGTAVIDVNYDASQLEIVSCQADKDERFGIGECNTNQPNQVSIGLLLGKGSETIWHLADITFKHIGTSQASSKLEINVEEFTDINANPLTYTPLHGEINVGYRMYLPFIER